jgi:hypothetical protein
MKVKVVNIEDGGFYKDAYVSGNCVKVTLQRGKAVASCEQILIWDEEYAEDCFEDWKDCALAGEAGYTYTDGAN